MEGPGLSPPGYERDGNPPARRLRQLSIWPFGFSSLVSPNFFYDDVANVLRSHQEDDDLSDRGI